jgi:AcrR family transcriptional regulator
MGIAERRNKEREELKSQILNAARNLFIERGIAETSIRNIAEQIEYSPATIYLYFKDKDEILHELHSQGFRELGNNMAVLRAVSDPFERLKAMGRVYLDYAKTNPEMYDLMFIVKAPMDYLEKMHQEEWHEGKAAFDILQETVAACIAGGRFQGHESGSLSFLVWSVVHGMVALQIRDRCKGVSDEDPEIIFKHAFEAFIKVLEKL